MTSHPTRILTPFRLAGRARVLAVVVTLVVPFAGWSTVAFAKEGDAPAKVYGIPAGEAIVTLKQFSEQSGLELLYSVDAVEGVQTNAVKGAFTAQEAITRLLAQTPLKAVYHEKSGGFGVIRSAEKEEKRGQIAPAKSNRPTAEPVIEKTGGKNDQEVIELSPFIVTSDDLDGYRVKRTLAGTRLATNLDDIGTSLQVITQQFLRDTGATNNQSLLTLTTSTEVAGGMGNFANAGTGRAPSAELLRPDNSTRIRGLTSADSARDFERTDIPWDAYNIDTVEIQRGPNSLLFGDGSPAGLINASLKQAGFKNQGRIEARFGAHGSRRATLDLNRVLLEDQLAMRLDYLTERTEYQQRPSFRNDQRIFGALRYDPKFLNRGSAHTMFRANYENGTVKSSNPAYIPPYDRITPFFETGTVTVNGREFPNPNKHTVDFRIDGSYVSSVGPSYGTLLSFTPNYIPKYEQIGAGYTARFADPNSSTQSGYFMMPSTYFVGQTYGLAPSGVIDGNIYGLDGGSLGQITGYTQAAINMGLPFANNYRDRSVIDPTIFDFYKNNIFGSLPRQDLSFEAFNLVFSQTFFKNRVGVEAKYDRQHYAFFTYNPFGVGLHLTIDINEILTDLSPNPNLGRPYMESDSYYGNSRGTAERDAKRLLAFAELRGSDIFKEKSRLEKLFKRQVFTASYNENSRTAETRSFMSSGLAYGDKDGIIQPILDQRRIKTYSYLGPSLLNATTASGANLSRINALQTPFAETAYLFNSHWNRSTNPSAPDYVNPADPWYNTFTRQNMTQADNPANYVGWQQVPVRVLSIENGDESALTHPNATKTLEKQASKTLVWQGFFFNGAIVGTYGYREDSSEAYRVVAPRDTLTNGSRLNDPGYVLPTTPYNTVEGINRTYSVVGHTPQFLRKYLPKRTDLSVFFNGSTNFKPDAQRVDLLNKPLPRPTGKTREYGLVATFLDGDFHLKLTKFKTEAMYASFSIDNGYAAGLVDFRAWGMAKRFEAGLSGNPLYAGPNYNFGTFVSGVGFVQTAEDRAKQQAAVKAVLDNFYPELWEAWKMTPSDDLWQNGIAYLFFNGQTPPAQGTSNTVSDGYELEVYWKPTTHWNVTLNVAKIKAAMSDVLGGTIQNFIKSRNEVWQGPAGDIRLYGGTATETVRSQWETFIWQPFVLRQMLDGTVSTELPKWRFNAITTYKFTKGRLKGAFIGGSYSWQSKTSLGYPSVRKVVAGKEQDTFDIENPFYGPTDSTTNMWVGYSRPLRRGLLWDVKLNVNNVFGKDELIPINFQPDGSYAAFRIKYGPSWFVTTSLEF